MTSANGDQFPGVCRVCRVRYSEGGKWWCNCRPGPSRRRALCLEPRPRIDRELRSKDERIAALECDRNSYKNRGDFLADTNSQLRERIAALEGFLQGAIAQIDHALRTGNYFELRGTRNTLALALTPSGGDGGAEPSDGTCCEGGRFGESHECRKSDGSDPARTASEGCPECGGTLLGVRPGLNGQPDRRRCRLCNAEWDYPDCAPTADDHEPGAVPYKGGPMVGCPAAPGSPSNDEPCATCGGERRVKVYNRRDGHDWKRCPSCAEEADDA